MDVKYIEKWTESPVVGRRRKAIRLLTQLTIHGKYDLDKTLNIVRNAINDDAWQVRAVAVSSFTQLALFNSKVLDDATKVLLEKIRDDKEHANVRGNALRGMARLIEKYGIDIPKDTYDLCLSLLDAPNNDIKHGSISILVSIALRMREKLDEILDKMRDTIKDLPPLLKRESLVFMRRLYMKYPQETSEVFTKISMDLVGDENYMARSEALRNLAYLVKNDHIAITDELLTMLRKRLRDTKNAVKMAAMDVIDAILEKNSGLADKYLDIITNEILLKSKSRRLKIRTLECILRHINNIPRDIVNKHNLPRVLDILEYNTIPKNQELQKIKILARTILEEKLGYTYEMRKRLRETS